MEKKISIEKLLIASGNKNKIREISMTGERYGFTICSPDEIFRADEGLSPPDVEETAVTYYGNSKLKADAFFEASSGISVLADDSGIEVRALDNAPGIYSARFAGEGATAAQNNAKLLAELSESEDRYACLRTVLCVKISEGIYLHTEGELHGEIVTEPTGESGWGYEPLFYLPEHDATISQLRDRKQKFETHRTRALEKMFRLIGSFSAEG